MKKLGAVIATVLGLAYAGPSHAGYTGYYTASFTYPGGTFSQCFHLTQTNSVQGYKPSGTWVDVNIPNSGGQWLQYKSTFHLAGYLSDPYGGQLEFAVDGSKMGPVLSNTTFDLFSPNGVYIAAGTFTEVPDASSCGSSDARKAK